ncbi:DODA-type extradiol aromatic ring-opening family dioxygenase [Paenibacillus radicis (ex Xue et al. 2023)]|uniref:Dioxygenase n=1 Tax=Paenibacillus radicis (ex Xue et al. 2023) TaxID=2972489 RepID=A0ABT1YSN3_9BACL|nr:class III extradiol ring-cleavage dioxygenase [Paenibacillus radicis (ex Xue et al. 2023)]MCR8636012.1 dioxygenase [Paenibacillus radicis (ex Xue et al. 2023)]
MGASYFIGHGSPMLALQDIPYTQDIRRLGEQLGKPEAVILFSAHWEKRELSLTYTDSTYETIYDFGGFPDALFRVKYPAVGSKEIAEEVHALLESAGIASQYDTTRGLDHGAWVILKHLFPEADIPVITLSVNPYLPPAQQYSIGQALAVLAEQRNIVIIGSGATVHNFRKLDLREPDRVDDWAKEFDDWMIQHIQSWDTVSLFDYERLAPHAQDATPDQEHFLPLFLAMGAGDKHRKPELIHQSYQYRSLSNMILKF